MSRLIILFGCVYLVGCALHPPWISPKERISHAHHLAKKAHWTAHRLHTTVFTLQSYGSPRSQKSKYLTLYIEGDGLAWLSEDTPSDNPTPIIPMALKMALHDRKNVPIAYLARPCQFVLNEGWRGCQRAYWTNLRFSPEVIESMNQAVDHLKHYYHAQHIRLIGYSGGGTVATLIAARRNDVIELITVAAILDTEQWVRQQSLTPLSGSLNPADAWENLVSIPQTHWVGGKDTVAPKELAFAFVQRFPPAKKPKIRIVPAFDHRCCWATDWRP